MPFKSEAHAQKIAMLEKEGKIPPGTYEKFKAETPSMDRLPEKLQKVKFRPKRR